MSQHSFFVPQERSRSRWTRRDLVKIGSLAAFGTLVGAGCTYRRKLRVANWADLIAPDTIGNFEREHRCEVLYDNYSSNEELAAKLRDSGRSYDVVFPSDYMVERLRDEGLLGPLEHARLDNKSFLDSRFLGRDYDPANEFSLPYTYWGTGLAVNTARFPREPEVGREWADLNHPAATGRITMLDEMRYTVGLGLIMNGFSVNSAVPSEVDAAANSIIALKPRMLAFVTDVIDLLVAGDPALSYAYSGDVYQAASANAAIAFRVPSTGGIVGIDNMCITASCDDRQLAHLFLNYLMRPEIAANFTQHTFYATPNRAAVEEGLIPAPLLNDPAIFLPIFGDDISVLRDLGPANDLYAAAWERIKAA